MVLVFAHPDDESVYTGATVAKYVKAGWQVDLICAVRVDGVRQKELTNAATLLGISSLTFLGYVHGELAQEPPGELEDKIYLKLEELVPDCVITFDTTGIDNDPDHTKICYATTFAFQKYAFWIQEQRKGSGAPKLYYACVPQTVVTYLKKKKVFPQESFRRPFVGTPDKFISAVISTAGFERTKKKALLIHKKQVDNTLLKHEYFIWRLHGTREIFMGNNDRVSSKL